MKLFASTIPMLLLLFVQNSSARPFVFVDNFLAIPETLTSVLGSVIPRQNPKSSKEGANAVSLGFGESNASANSHANFLINGGVQLGAQKNVEKFQEQLPPNIPSSTTTTTTTTTTMQSSTEKAGNISYGVGGNNNGAVGSMNSGSSGDNQVSNGIGGGNTGAMGG